MTNRERGAELERWCVLFDVDGTLIDAGRAGSRAMTSAFLELYGKKDAMKGVRFDGMTDAWIIDQAAERNDLPPFPDGSREQQYYFRIYLDHLHDQVQNRARSHVHPGIRRLIDRLLGTGRVSLGLATGNIEAGAREKLTPHDLNGYFPGGGFGDDHRDRAELTALAAERIGLLSGHVFPPQCVAVVGDSEHDIAAARKNGFYSVVVATGYTEPQLLRSRNPDLFFDDFRDTDKAAESICGLLSSRSG